MVIGQILILSSFQSFLEKTVLRILCQGSNRNLRDLVLKNLQSHRNRNTKTSSMFTICLSYVIFAATMFTLQAKSLSQTQEWFAGADVSITGGSLNDPLPEANLIIYLDEIVAVSKVVLDYTFVTIPLDSLNEVDATLLSHITFFNDPRIQLYGIGKTYCH